MNANSMNANEMMAIVPKSELSFIKTKLEILEEKLTQKETESISKQFIDSKQVPKLLKVSPRTWQNYRDKGEIPFIQFGQKVWVKWKDLEAFMDKHYINKNK